MVLSRRAEIEQLVIQEAISEDGIPTLFRMGRDPFIEDSHEILRCSLTVIPARYADTRNLFSLGLARTQSMGTRRSHRCSLDEQPFVDEGGDLPAKSIRRVAC